MGGGLRSYRQSQSSQVKRAESENIEQEDHITVDAGTERHCDRNCVGIGMGTALLQAYPLPQDKRAIVDNL